MAELKGIDIIYLVLGILYSLIAGGLIAPLTNYYSTKGIPETYELTVINNLKQSPIYDIKVDSSCDVDGENILGRFEGTYEGWKESSKYYLDKSDCRWSSSCSHIKSIDSFEYYKLKNSTICTSKKVQKTYFDFPKTNTCNIGQKKCGYLDKYNRVLCVGENEECPINDIVYSNNEDYTEDKIKYNSVKLKDGGYLHYTNKKTNGYIIIGLMAPINGYPCGVDDTIFKSIHPLDKFPTCYTTTSVNNYFYKLILTISIKDFLTQNQNYNNLLQHYGTTPLSSNMGIFSYGYIGLSDEFLKEKPNINFISDLNKKMKKKKWMEFYLLSFCYYFFFLWITFYFYWSSCL